MSNTQKQLESFHQFAQQRINEDPALSESLEALRRGIADAHAGRVRPAQDVFADLADRYGASLDKSRSA
jgi:predicted transcriptional regulator